MPKALKEIWDKESTECFPDFLQFFDGKYYQALLNAKNDTRFVICSSIILCFNRRIVTVSSHSNQCSRSLVMQCCSASFMKSYGEDVAQQNLCTSGEVPAHD